MTTDGTGEQVEIEVAIPRELLDEIDRFAVRHGYENPSAVVREAIEEKTDDT